MQTELTALGCAQLAAWPSDATIGEDPPRVERYEARFTRRSEWLVRFQDAVSRTRRWRSAETPG